MILGIGHDIADIERFADLLEEQGDRFLERCFTAQERAGFAALPPARRAAFAAKRWAAKEACAKALGTGIAQDVFLKDIEVRRQPSGAPAMALSGGALARLKSLTPPGREAHIHVSLSDEARTASAFVVISVI